MHTYNLPEDYTAVLQQIDEDGAEDFNNLAESLQINRPRLAHIITSLQHKGLVSLQGSGERGFFVRLSRKGERLMRYLWPESRGMQPSY